MAGLTELKLQLKKVLLLGSYQKIDTLGRIYLKNPQVLTAMFRYNGEVGFNFETLYRAIKSFANSKKEEFKRYEILSGISRSELFTLFLGQFCFGLNTVVRLLRDEAKSVPQKWGLARGDLAELSCTDHRPLAEESALFKSYFAKLDKIYFYALDQEIFGVFAATNKTILLEEREEYSVSSTTGFLCMYDAKSLAEEFFPQKENRDISLALRLLYYHLDFRREGISVLSYMAFLLGEALYETESTSQEPLILVANEAIGKAKGSFYNFFHNIRTPWDVGKRLEDGTYENSESYYYPGGEEQAYVELAKELDDQCFDLHGKPINNAAIYYLADPREFHQMSKHWVDLCFRQPGADVVAKLVSDAKEYWQ